MATSNTVTAATDPYSANVKILWDQLVANGAVTLGGNIDGVTALGAALVKAAGASDVRALLSLMSSTETTVAISNAINAVIAGAPAAINTLDELAAALGDDANFAATLTGLISAKYTKPGTGIPKTDTASAVQASLTAADSAAGLIAAKYTKPGSGIPKTDLSSAVQASLTAADSGGGGGGAGGPTTLWSPSDATGATDMTTELEKFCAANPRKTVKVAPGSKIKLANAFSTVTTGDLLLDFTDCVVVYDHMTSGDAAIKADNTSNASSEVSVTALSMVTVNTDATVSQVTLGATLSAKRFDWIALYSADVNPAQSGGVLGETFQLLSDETALNLTATRKLNRHSAYTSSVKARKLSAARRVHIRGGTFTANGNAEDPSVIDRGYGIWLIGFVDPVIEDVTYERPWSVCTRIQCCAAPRWSNITVKNVGNLANYNGYTYGVQLYGMSDQADGRNIVVRNGRHAGITTDGNSSKSANWWDKGIPTNALVQGVHGYNCHASVVDAHEEGDNIVFDGVHSFYAYQDADVNPNFTGLAVQIRASNVTVRNLFVYGGTRGIKVNALDHGFEDTVVLENIHIRDLTPSASVDGDTALQIDDQNSLVNKRHVYFDGVLRNVGRGITVGRSAKLTVRSVTMRGVDTLMDVNPGATVVFAGPAEFDYRGITRTAPYYGVRCRSDSAQGGSTVVFLRDPTIIKGTDNTPVALLEESDTAVMKTVYIPGIREYNPSGVIGTLLKTAGAKTFATAAVSMITGDEGTGGSVATLTYATTVATNAALASHYVLTITNSTAFAMATPTLMVAGQEISYEIRNSCGGAHGTITWNAVFLKQGPLTVPSPGRMLITFHYNGTNWVEVSRTGNLS